MSVQWEKNVFNFILSVDLLLTFVCVCFRNKTKEALVTILDELPEDDYFAIVVFSSYFVVWKPHLSKATPENVKAAQEYVKTIEVVGSKYEY